MTMERATTIDELRAQERVLKLQLDALRAEITRQMQAETCSRLTARQCQVLDLVRQGMSDKEIAAEIHVTERGAKFHVSWLLKKFGVQSRRELL